MSVKQAASGFYYVNGTPTDCVHVAVTGFLDFRPDIVVSGINHGPNMGDDTLYSGTVAAATEAFLLGIPAIAVSLAGKNRHFRYCRGQVAANLVRRFQAQPFSRPMLLNVNVPDIPAEQLAGTEVTRLGRRHHAEPVIRANNPRGDSRVLGRPGRPRARRRPTAPIFTPSASSVCLSRR